MMTVTFENSREGRDQAAHFNSELVRGGMAYSPIIRQAHVVKILKVADGQKGIIQNILTAHNFSYDIS